MRTELHRWFLCDWHSAYYNHRYSLLWSLMRSSVAQSQWFCVRVKSMWNGSGLRQIRLRNSTASFHCVCHLSLTPMWCRKKGCSNHDADFSPNASVVRRLRAILSHIDLIVAANYLPRHLIVHVMEFVACKIIVYCACGVDVNCKSQLTF